MTGSLTLPLERSPPRSQAGVLSRAAPLLVALFALACVAINPIGYIGGGADDHHYFQAAQCWVRSAGPCLPTSHWGSRWPVVAPLAIAIQLFGESRAAAALAPLLYWAAVVALAGWLGARWFDRASGLVAAMLVASTPAITAAALQPMADVPELALQLAALAAATRAFHTQRRGWAAIAGALTGLAVMTRETSVLFVGAAGLAWLCLARDRRSVLLWALPAFAGVMLGEAVVYWAFTGDPLYRLGLSVHHVAVPSDELPARFDTRQRPFFNPAYIASWRREAGVHVFWPLDPWLNLLASPKIAQTLLAAPLLAAVAWRKSPAARRRAVLLLAGCALLVAVLLVYALAIDPKPRMFVALATAGALCAGALAATAWRAGRRELAATILGLCLLLNLTTLARLPSTRPFVGPAQQWLRNRPQAVEADETTAAYLDLTPEAKLLAPVRSGRPLRLAMTLTNCEAFVAPAPHHRQRATVLDWAGEQDPARGRMCLLRYLPGLS